MRADAYKKSGVDIRKNEAFVGAIKRLLAGSPASNSTQGIGSFAALYDGGGSKYLAASTDGVGTKVLLAQQYNRHRNIGIDLVAMSVNDLLCCGARPVFFLDYLAYAGLSLEVLEEIAASIVAGCEQAGCFLIGGETAEMPGLYQAGAYDLAGFAVGEVEKSQVIDGKAITPGDVLIGIASSGFHANGYSLLRSFLAAIPHPRLELIEGLLAPTRIYVRPITRLLEQFPQHIKGLAHITGSGFHNIRRINTSVAYDIEYVPSFNELPPVFSSLLASCSLPPEELYSTFNMGIGMVLAVSKESEPAVLTALREYGEKAWKIGTIIPGNGTIKVRCANAYFELNEHDS